jgi:hypothetical protein
MESYEGDGLDIPAFLKRPKNVSSGLPNDKGNPARHGSRMASQSSVAAPTYSAEPECRKRWPLTDRDKAVIAELQSGAVATEKDKSYSRINKLKVGNADKAALAAGKRWDTARARWIV